MLELNDIFVRYTYKTVLDGVSLSFESGKIYALLGENGAGKSTLAKVISGEKHADGGKMLLGDKSADFLSPHDAQKAGVCCVHQIPALVENISIEENILLGQKLCVRTAKRRLLRAKMDALFQEWLPGKDLAMAADALSQEERFFVSLVNALLKSPKVLVLDEPPYISSEKLRALAQGGMCIILITHHLREALEKSDYIVLLQKGRVLENNVASAFSEEYIAEKLYGLNPMAHTGAEFSVITQGEDVFFEGIYKNQHDGRIGYIPSEIAVRAANPNMTVLQLMTIWHEDLPPKKRADYAAALLHRADVNITLQEKVTSLSGGMLQRLVLERELAENPKELYLFNPFHGLDVKATERLYARLKKLALQGVRVHIGQGEAAE